LPAKEGTKNLLKNLLWVFFLQGSYKDFGNLPGKEHQKPALKLA
jgi:hypothetical protein